VLTSGTRNTVRDENDCSARNSNNDGNVNNVRTVRYPGPGPYVPHILDILVTYEHPSVQHPRMKAGQKKGTTLRNIALTIGETWEVLLSLSDRS